MTILALLHPGTNSRDIMEDMLRGYETLGHTVIRWDLGPLWTLQARADADERFTEHSRYLERLLERNDFGLVVGLYANSILSTLNRMEKGEPRSIFDAAGVPHLMFWLDAPQWAGNLQFASLFRTSLVRERVAHHLINNHATAREMSEVLGFEQVHARPYGIDPSRFEGLDSSPRFDLVVGLGAGDPRPTDLMRQELERDEPDLDAIRVSMLAHVHRRIDRVCERQGFGNTPRSIAHELAATQRDDWRTPLLDRLRQIDAEGVLVEHPAMFCRLTNAVRTMERWVRPFTVAWLSRRCRVAAFGRGSLDAWGCEATKLGHVESQGDAYRLGAAGLNVMRGQDDAGLNLKPLEIAASGRACLCAWRPGLDEIFDDDEIVSFESPREALDGLERLRADPSIADRARHRVLRDWTWESVNRVTLECIAHPARTAALG